MNGMAEFGVVLLVALLVLGPERLPAAARMLGSLLRRWRQVREYLTREWEQQLLHAELQHNQERAKIAEAVAARRPEQAAESSSTT